MDLEFTIENQKLTRTDTEKPVNLSENYLNLLFTFESSDWDGLAKFVIFNEEVKVAIVNGSVTVPSSVMNSDRFYFMVYGVDTEDDTTIRITTNYVKVYLGESRFNSDAGSGGEDIPATVVEEIYIAIAAVDNNVDTLRTDTEDALDLKTVDVVKQATAEEGYFATYVVTQNDGEQVGSKINIPKDFLVKSASVETCTVDGEPVSSLHIGDLYLDFVVNTVDASETDNHLYIDVSDLTDVYTADGVTLVLDDGVFSVKENVFADVTHNHDERYYTQTEVDNLIYSLNNRILIDGDDSVIQSNDTTNIRAYLTVNGMPKANTTVTFYKED